MTQIHEQAEHRSGSVQAAVSNAVVRLVRDYTGRGPTRARTTIEGDLVTVLMRDTLTKAERHLADDGKGDLVRLVRHEFQKTMREDMIQAVEALTDRKVIAFMSDNHVEPDMAIEAFVLESTAAASEDGAGG
jgi:uncharacterized protein YbcI